MAAKVCRWGILGTANIARKNWQSIVNSGNGKLVAVASRSPERAETYIGECQAQAPHPHRPAASDYEGLISHPEIDAIYIPLPTGVRKEWAIKAAKAGKHVLCEKPCGANAGEVREIIDVCQKQNVQFMDGVMFMHSERLPLMRSVLDDGQSIGDIRRIHSHFSFLAPPEFLQGNIRVNHELEPLGSLGDLGWYNVRFILWALNYALPQQVTGRILTGTAPADDPTCVPLEFSGELFFDGGVSAGFYCSFLSENMQTATISGTKGFLSVDDFVLPFYGSEATFDVRSSYFDIRGCSFGMQERRKRHAVAEYSNNAPGSQETNLFRNFAALVVGGKPDPHWPTITLKTQQVLDACLRSARNSCRPTAVQ